MERLRWIPVETAWKGKSLNDVEEDLTEKQDLNR